MSLAEITNLLLKISIVTESFILFSYITAYYLLLTSDIKNGLNKALSTTFLSGSIYSLTIIVSLFLLNSDFFNVIGYWIFPYLTVIFFISRFCILLSRLYLGHELRSIVIKQIK